MVEIQIPDKDECAKAFSALIRRGRVDCFRENVFIVHEPALDFLREMGVAYQVLGRGADYCRERDQILPAWDAETMVRKARER